MALEIKARQLVTAHLVEILVFLGTKHSDKEDSYSSDIKCQCSSVLLLRRTDFLGGLFFSHFEKILLRFRYTLCYCKLAVVNSLIPQKCSTISVIILVQNLKDMITNSLL